MNLKVQIRSVQISVALNLKLQYIHLKQMSQKEQKAQKKL